MRSDRTVLQPGWTVLIPADAAADPAPAGAPSEPAGAAARTVTVQRGDTLSQIAWDATGSADWTALWDANAGRDEPGGQQFDDPDYLEPGWTIAVPAPGGADSTGTGADKSGSTPAAAAVVVRPGDTLSGIAADHDADLGQVIAVNVGVPQPDGGRLTDPDLIVAGLGGDPPGLRPGRPTSGR